MMQPIKGTLFKLVVGFPRVGIVFGHLPILKKLMTFRNPNRVIELEGENYVRGIVQSFNCIFQVIEGRNDQGNDAYIEFVVDNQATNFGIFVQIKSGISYKDNTGYKIPTDIHHLQYWSKALYPMLGIVYDPELQQAFWVDIKEYITKNMQVLGQKSHAIRVSTLQPFSKASFEVIQSRFIEKIQEFKTIQNFGQSLDYFADTENSNTCYEGFKSLYANHRDKRSTWFYILSAFANIKEEGIRRNILGVLSNYLDNPYIFWHADNLHLLPSPDMQKQIKSIVNETFGRDAIMLSLQYLKDGISAGSFSYLVYRIIDQVDKAHLFLKEIAFEAEINSDDRNHIFWLYLHTAKHHSVEETLHTADEYLKLFPCGYNDEALMGTKESIENGDLTPIGHF